MFVTPQVPLLVTDGHGKAVAGIGEVSLQAHALTQH
jgi:hypothetical protein